MHCYFKAIRGQKAKYYHTGTFHRLGANCKEMGK